MQPSSVCAYMYIPAQPTALVYSQREGVRAMCFNRGHVLVPPPQKKPLYSTDMCVVAQVPLQSMELQCTCV